jgi:aryl-alcohol dehydrogenase-like predicted oxidoreductase
MNFRKLNHTNEQVSEIGIGVWSLVTDWWGADVSKAEEIMKKGFDEGINFFNTADMYGNGKGEEIIGKLFSSKRDRIVIATKIGYDFYHKKDNHLKQNFNLDYLQFALKKSLERLNTDYVDVLMIHNPKMEVIDNNAVLNFMKEVKRDGIAKTVGVALGPTLGWGEEGTAALKKGYEGLEYIYNIIEQEPGETFLKNQEAFHLIRVPHATDVLNEGKWPIKESPNMHRSLKDFEWVKKAYERTQGLLEFCRRKNVKLSQLALMFVLYNPNVTSVFPNISNLDELETFLKVEEFEPLNEEDMKVISSYYRRNYKDLNVESIGETIRYK